MKNQNIPQKIQIVFEPAPPELAERQFAALTEIFKDILFSNDKEKSAPN